MSDFETSQANINCIAFHLALRQYGEVGFTAPRVCIEGTDAGQAVEPIPHDHTVQSHVVQQCCLCMQKGI